MIAALLIASWLQPAGPAAAIRDEDGTVVVWEAGEAGWRPIHACALGAPEPSAMAWVGDVLFIACPRAPLARWAPGAGRAKPVAGAALARRRPTRLAGGSALFFSEGRELWGYWPEGDRLVHLGRFPGVAIRRLIEVEDGLLVAGERTWLWRDGTFEPLAGRSRDGD